MKIATSDVLCSRKLLARMAEEKKRELIANLV